MVLIKQEGPDNLGIKTPRIIVRPKSYYARMSIYKKYEYDLIISWMIV